MFAYDAPDVVGTARRGAAAAERPSVADLGRAVWRRKLLTLGAALIGAALAVGVGKSLTPRYVATTQLYLDPRDLQLVDREITPRVLDANTFTALVESQTRVIVSSSVLLPVVDGERLTLDPEFVGRRGFFAGAAEAPEAVRTAALDGLTRRVNVRRGDRTFIVDVEVSSEDAEKAARLANAVAASYLAQGSAVRAAATARASDELSSRLKQLEERVRDAENRVQTYKAQNNLVGTRDLLVSDQQLTEMNQQLGQAHARTLDAQARLDQIARVRGAALDDGAAPEALASQALAGLRTQYAEARRRQADLANELGPLHPGLRSIDLQVASLRRGIEDEIGRFAQAARNEVERTRAAETALAKGFEAAKRRTLDGGQASVRLREYERDAEATRTVYQSFLARARETAEQVKLDTSNAHVIGPATKPRNRISPPSMTVLATLGGALGSLAGMALAVALDRAGADPFGRARDLATASRPGRSSRSGPRNRTQHNGFKLSARSRAAPALCQLATAHRPRAP